MENGLSRFLHDWTCIGHATALPGFFRFALGFLSQAFFFEILGEPFFVFFDPGSEFVIGLPCYDAVLGGFETGFLSGFSC